MFSKRLHCLRSASRLDRQRCQSRPARQMLLESLEDRRCLAANPLAFDLPALEIDPDSFDASSLIVRYRSDGSARDEGADTYGPSRIVGSKSLGGGMEKVELAPGVALQSILGLYQKDPAILYAEPNYRVQIAVTPDDTRFNEQWALHNEGQTNGLYDADIDATGGVGGFDRHWIHGCCGDRYRRGLSPSRPGSQYVDERWRDSGRWDRQRQQWLRRRCPRL